MIYDIYDIIDYTYNREVCYLKNTKYIYILHNAQVPLKNSTAIKIGDCLS